MGGGRGSSAVGVHVGGIEGAFINIVSRVLMLMLYLTVIWVLIYKS